MTPERMAIKISRMGRDTKYAVQRGWFKVGKLLVATANKDILSSEKSGRTYVVRRGPSGRRVRHVASAPGETFANRSGAARRTLTFKVRKDELEFGFKRGRKTDYVRYLEDPQKLNRPALGNAVRKRANQIPAILEREMKGRLSK